MNKHWSFYDAATGLFDGGSICIPEHADPAENLPAGHVVIEGVFDRLTHKVDVVAREVVSYRPGVDVEHLAARSRAKRDGLLIECDWTQVGDSPLSASGRAAWQLYRTALRNIPAQPGFPLDVLWPNPPA